MPASPAAARIRIVLADDHAIVRNALATLLGSIPDFEVVADASSGDELLQLIDFQRPDIVLTDIRMPGLDGLEALAVLRERYPQLPVVIVSMLDSADVIRRAVASGARGYLLKSASFPELEHAVRRVAANEQYFSPALATILMRDRTDGPAQLLTERQIEILKLSVTGLSSREVGLQLGLSFKTVDVHKSRIMKRLDIHDLATLTRYALKNGLVPSEG